MAGKCDDRCISRWLFNNLLKAKACVNNKRYVMAGYMNGQVVPTLFNPIINSRKKIPSVFWLTGK
jgi:hypothetical protein